MNGVPFLRQEFCKIEILRHDCVYFSIVAATQSECWATRRTRFRPDWLRPRVRPLNRRRCKLLPYDDETQRRKRRFVRVDNCPPPAVHRALRKDESLAMQCGAGMATI